MGSSTPVLNLYRSGVLTCVNMGYDADSTAAVAGGLAGLYYGYNSIPAEWINALAAKEIIEECIQSLENWLRKQTVLR